MGVRVGDGVGVSVFTKTIVPAGVVGVGVVAAVRVGVQRAVPASENGVAGRGVGVRVGVGDGAPTVASTVVGARVGMASAVASGVLVGVPVRVGAPGVVTLGVANTEVATASRVSGVLTDVSSAAVAAVVGDKVMAISAGAGLAATGVVSAVWVGSGVSVGVGTAEVGVGVVVPLTIAVSAPLVFVGSTLAGNVITGAPAVLGSSGAGSNSDP